MPWLYVPALKKKEKKADVHCVARLTVTNKTGQTLNYAWGSNMHDQVLIAGGTATKEVGEMDIKYDKWGNETTRTSSNVPFDEDNFSLSIVVDECDERYDIN